MATKNIEELLPRDALDRLHSGNADIRDFDEEKLVGIGVRWPEEQAVYHQLYNGKARGDLVLPFRTFIQHGKEIPVDFELVKYEIEEDERLLYGNQYFLPKNDAGWESLRTKTRSRLPALTQSLNGIYRTPTEGKLRFTLRNISESQTEDSFVASTTVFPGEDCVGPIDHLLVRVVAIPYFPIEGEGIDTEPLGGIYRSKGIIDLAYTEALHPLDRTLAHEIGHGIFGYDHHKDRQCIMDDGMDAASDLTRSMVEFGFVAQLPANVIAGPGFERKKDFPVFCEEDIKKLRDLCGLK